MLALSGLSANKPLLFAAVAVCFFAAAVLMLLVFRLAFGRRLRMSGGRARQMRLGIVDAFDLDRQRQLVIVRRDNVEHLVMIGGPNDVLIESQIVRAERDLRDGRSRDKELREKDVREAPQLPQTTPAKQADPKLPLPLFMPEAQQPAAQEPAPPVRLQPVGRVPGSPTSSMVPPGAPPRRQPLRPGLKPLPPEPPRKAGVEQPVLPPVPRNPPAQPATPPAASLPAAAPWPPILPAEPAAPGAGPAKAPEKPPNFLRWPARPAPAKPPSPAPKPTPPSNAPPSNENPAPSQPVPDAMESLEEEMAKLLGRDPGKS